MKKNLKKTRHSFTLIEILLATSIFVILIVLGITAFGNILNWKKRDTSGNELQAAGRHAMEVMTQAVEGVDLNYPSSGNNNYGFAMSNLSSSFPDGPVTGATQIRIFSETATTTFYYLNNRLNKDDGDSNSYLTPSNIEVTNLTFDGYQKTSTSFQSSSYQQPYVTISMTLKSTQPDPEDPTKFKSATFKTTVRPQSFDNLGYVRVKSGYDPLGTVTFPRPSFQKAPIVVSAKDEYRFAGTRDHWTYVDNITTNDFRLHIEPGAGDDAYWLAVEGSWPELIYSGKTRIGDLNQPIVFPKQFSSTPSVVIMRGFESRDLNDQMAYVSAPSATGFNIEGDCTYSCGGKSADSPFYWVAIQNNLSLENFLKTGSQRNGTYYTCSSYYDIDSMQTKYYQCYIDHSISFPTAFIGLNDPNTVISYYYPSTLGGLNEWYTTPGVSISQNNSFRYYTTPTINFPHVNDFTLTQLNIFRNIGINYIAAKDNFQLTWSYDKE